MKAFSNFSQFLDMGGYALYVWSAYGIALSVLILNLFLSRKYRQKTIKTLQKKLSATHDFSTKKT